MGLSEELLQEYLEDIKLIPVLADRISSLEEEVRRLRKWIEGNGSKSSAREQIGQLELRVQALEQQQKFQRQVRLALLGSALSLGGLLLSTLIQFFTRR